MKQMQAELLDIAYLEGGPVDGWPVLMLHGWPVDPDGLTDVTVRLQAQGLRTIVPWPRGFCFTCLVPASGGSDRRRTCRALMSKSWRCIHKA